MRTFGPDVASVEVLVFREGLLSAVGHDLVLRATSFEIAVDPEPPSASARIDAASLRVASAMRDGRPLPQGALSASDVREIESTLSGTVLRVRRFPEIRFRSTAVSGREGGREVRGTLSLAGRDREIAFVARREGDRLVALVRLHQPDFGIAPYRAMLGALRVKPDVVVRAAVPAERL
jgi:polyisoprenoid-binding protein YceI